MVLWIYRLDRKRLLPANLNRGTFANPLTQHESSHKDDLTSPIELLFGPSTLWTIFVHTDRQHTPSCCTRATRRRPSQIREEWVGRKFPTNNRPRENYTRSTVSAIDQRKACLLVVDSSRASRVMAIRYIQQKAPDQYFQPRQPPSSR